MECGTVYEYCIDAGDGNMKVHILYCTSLAQSHGLNHGDDKGIENDS